MTTSLEAISFGPSTGQRRNALVVRPRSSRCPSLVELATAKVSANIERCLREDQELWRMLPPSILLSIYSQLLSHDRLTADAWSVISTNLFACKVGMKRSVLGHTSRAFSPTAGGTIDPKHFTLRLGLAWSPDVNFITHLTLESTCKLDKEYLLMLSEMRNLGMLRIVEPKGPYALGSRVTDRVIRGWSEKNNPFPVLRILQLSCCVEVTPECLRYLSRFPSLTYFTTRGFKRDWRSARITAPSHGWRGLDVVDDVQVLMMRYFASCLGLQEEMLPEHLLRASERISQNERAGPPCLFGDSDTVEFGKRLTVLPWEGAIPTSASMKSPDDAAVPMRAQGYPKTVCDNPMWWIYNAIGHVIFRDEDLKSVNSGIGTTVPTSNGWLLPPLPVLTLSMAPQQPPGASFDNIMSRYDESPERDDSHYTQLREHRLAKYSFVRIEAFEDVATRETPWKPGRAGPKPATQDEALARKRTTAPSMAPRQRKRQNMGDLLSMGGI